MIKGIIPGYFKSDNPDYVLIRKRILLITFYALTMAEKQLSEKLQCDLLELAGTIAQEASRRIAMLNDSEVETWISNYMKSSD